ncbi:MAG: hypothetical protein OHK0015_43150 [Chloroflexi bacterium OHK40]
MRSLLRLAVAAVFLLLLAAPALAQGRLIIEDPGGRLDEAAIQRAARPLIDRGATVAVYVVDSGGANDFTERMIDSGIARDDGALLSTVVAIYVAIEDRYSEIAYGDEWSDALSVNNNAEVIRQGDLNPGLSDGDFTRGVTEALTAIDAAIEQPPTPGGGTTINFDPTPIVAGGLGLAAVAGGAALFTRRRRAAQARASAQQRLKEAREGAGAVIADLGRRFNDAREKARYDQVSYTAADAARVGQLQQQAATRFAEVQARFDDAGEQLNRYEKPSNEQLAAAAAAYDQVKLEAQEVSAALRAVEELRARLDEQARQAREELDRAKKV